MIELGKVVDRYGRCEVNCLWLKNVFVVGVEELGDCVEEIGGCGFGGKMVWGGGGGDGVK